MIQAGSLGVTRPPVTNADSAEGDLRDYGHHLDLDQVHVQWRYDPKGPMPPTEGELVPGLEFRNGSDVLLRYQIKAMTVAIGDATWTLDPTEDWWSISPRSTSQFWADSGIDLPIAPVTAMVSYTMVYGALARSQFRREHTIKVTFDPNVLANRWLTDTKSEPEEVLRQSPVTYNLSGDTYIGSVGQTGGGQTDAG
jgi:hypothetical protein